MLTQEAVFQKIKKVNKILKDFVDFLYFLYYVKCQAGVVQLARM